MAAVATGPPLVLADEPTAALDTERGTKVMALLRKIARERRSAVITVTHDHRMIGSFDTIYHLDDSHLSRMAETAAKHRLSSLRLHARREITPSGYSSELEGLTAFCRRRRASTVIFS